MTLGQRRLVIGMVGAALAAVAGLGAGSLVRSPLDEAPEAEMASAQPRTPSAFESWFPSEGPPPPYVPDPVAVSSPDQAQLDRQIAALLAPDPHAQPVSAERPAEMAAATLPRGPQPYLPSASGDILAPAAAQAEAGAIPPALPPAEAPRWERAPMSPDDVLPAAQPVDIGRPPQ